MRRFMLTLVALSLCGGAVWAQDPKLQYEFKPSQEIQYRLKITAELPTSTEMHNGILTYTCLLYTSDAADE